MLPDKRCYLNYPSEHSTGGEKNEKFKSRWKLIDSSIRILHNWVITWDRKVAQYKLSNLVCLLARKRTTRRDDKLRRRLVVKIDYNVIDQFKIQLPWSSCPGTRKYGISSVPSFGLQFGISITNQWWYCLYIQNVLLDSKSETKSIIVWSHL